MKHSPEQHAIMHGLTETLTPLLPNLRLYPNEHTCEIDICNKQGQHLYYLDLDDQIEIWTINSNAKPQEPALCGVIAQIDYADPDFITKITTTITQHIKRRHTPSPSPISHI